MDKEQLLSKDVQEFIKHHESDDLSTLLLQRDKYPNLPLVEIVDQIRSRKKAKTKLPLWYGTDKIIYPKPVSIEQSSSEFTAEWKANFVGSGKFGIDLTGGFGVDSYSFARVFEHWTHVEPDQDLQTVVAHNAEVLGIKNINFVNLTAESYIQSGCEKVDFIYLDPDRRPEAQRVYGFKDSTPDITALLTLLRQYTSRILVKASPMIDINSALNELKDVNEVIVLSRNNEVKEVLFNLNYTQYGPVNARCINAVGDTIQDFNFIYNRRLQEVIKTSSIAAYLYEPNVAIMKSGGQDMLAVKYSLNKLHRNTHLFTAEKYYEDFPGRVFRVLANEGYNRKLIQGYLSDQKANLSTRNFSDTPAQMKKKLGTKDGGNIYLFGYRDYRSKNMVAVCVKPDGLSTER